MGIIAWIVLGLGAGLLANMLIPGKRSQGLILTQASMRCAPQSTPVSNVSIPTGREETLV